MLTSLAWSVRSSALWATWFVGCWVGHGSALVANQFLSSSDSPATRSAHPAWEDPTLTTEDRARRVLDAAGALDEQAQRMTSAHESRAKWLEGTRLLDEFLARNSEVALTTSLRYQAAVFCWARARSMLDQVDLLAATDLDRLEVSRGFDEAIKRLREVGIPPGAAGDSLAQNVRFRLAQALADRARLLPAVDPARNALEKEARSLLDRSLTAPRLQAFARLLHAELTNRLGEFGPAQIEIEELEKWKPPPPLITLTEAKINALAGRGRFGDANALAEGAAVSFEQKALWKLRITLIQRKVAVIGRDRDATEAATFQAARQLGDRSRPEAVRGLMELACAIDQPAADSPAEWWDLLADGQLLLHDPERAARLATRAADQAAIDQPDRVASMRYKSGACWFQAAKYENAVAALCKVLEEATALRSLRAKAGMLLALSRGRAWADRLPGATKATYLAALEAQTRDFGDDSSSGEARWLLGTFRLDSGRRGDAIALWSGIKHGSPRWLDAQQAAANQSIDAVEAQWVNQDATAIRPQVESTRKLIRVALDQASDAREAATIGFCLARLETIPGAGQPSEAISTYDRLLRGPAGVEQHQRARLGRMVALAELNRFGEAETIARNEVRGSEVEVILPAVRLLDQWAVLTESDLIRRRTGTLIRILLDPWNDPPDRAPIEVRDEIRLRHARALLFAGDPVGAKRSIARWGGPTGKIDDLNFLRDLGDTYFRLEAYSLAADAERLRAGQLSAGSPGWFEARYLLALGLYRSDRVKEARKIIDATMILHPDLGGGETRSKFERLNQKLQVD